MPSERIKITAEDYLIKLRVHNVRRADHGEYTLTATNRNGTDTATVSVTVIGEWGGGQAARRARGGGSSVSYLSLSDISSWHQAVCAYLQREEMRESVVWDERGRTWEGRLSGRVDCAAIQYSHAAQST